jgi:hypothetical protein
MHQPDKTVCFVAKFKCAFTCVAFLLSFAMRAQDLSPALSLSGSFYPSSNFKDTTGHYQHERIQASIFAPLLKRINTTENGFTFFLITMGVNAALDRTEISFLPTSKNFFAGNAFVSSIFKPNAKSLWTGRLLVSDFEDQTTIGNPSLRLSGFALYKRTVSEKFFYTAGGAYTFLFTKKIPIPVLGMGWHLSNHATFTMILPLSLTYRFGKLPNQYCFFTRLNGGITNFYNNNFSNGPDKIIFRRRELSAGVSKRFKLTDQLSLFAEGGILVKRRLTFSKNFTRDKQAVLFESKVKPGPYVSLGIRLRLKTKAEVIPNDLVDLD